MDKQLEQKILDILHGHYYPILHESIADTSLLECTHEVIKEIQADLRNHWIVCDLTDKPTWVKATIAGTEEYIFELFGKS